METIYEAPTQTPGMVTLVAHRETWESVLQRIGRPDVQPSRTIRAVLEGNQPGAVVRITLSPEQAQIVMGR